MSDETPRIKRIRELLDWPQWRIGEHVGLSQPGVARLEKGERESRSVAKLLDTLEADIARRGVDAVKSALEAPSPFTPETAA